MRKLPGDQSTRTHGRAVRFAGGPWEGVQPDVVFDRRSYPDVATRAGCYRYFGVNAAGEVVYAYTPGAHARAA
jgi:hypothetical protein